MNKRCVWAATVSKKQNEVVITFIVGKYKADQAEALAAIWELFLN